MTIGIDISPIIYQGTGTAVYTQNLVRNLLKIDKDNSYKLFGSSLRRKNILKLASQTINAKKYFFSLPPSLLNLLWNELHLVLIENFIGPVDIFHSSDWTQPPSKAKKVTTIHDLVVYKYPQYSHPKIVAVHQKRLARVKSECDGVIAVSQSTKQDIVEILKIPADKIRVIYEAVGEPFTSWLGQKNHQSVMAEVKKKYNLPDDFLLMVGTREPRKNFASVVAALKKLTSKDLNLVIAGQSGWDSDIKNWQDNLGQNLKILGFVPAEVLPPLYSLAKIFIYPSLYEGFGLPVLEAMTCQTPVITSNVSSLPEVGGSAATYVDPLNINDIAEKIEFLWNLNSTKKLEIIKSGITQAKKFSWERAAGETLNFYEELI